MLARIVELPLFVLFIGLSALAMLVPAAHGLATDAGPSARGFGYAALLTFVLFAMLALATWTHRVRQPIRANLVSILAFYAALPLLLAWPMTVAMDGVVSYGDAVFDMVSAITTTGAPTLPLNATPSPVHLWRAEVAWFGGFFVWVTAIAVLAPLNLGGFEVFGTAGPGRGAESFTQITRLAGQERRIRRYAAALFPIYAVLTGILWLALIASGDPPLVAMTHAMSTLSTSGLSPLGGPDGAASGLAGEGLILLFLVFALSRSTFATQERDDGLRTVLRDPELRLGLVIIVALPVLLFLRHWLAAIESDATVTALQGLGALWGAVFTTASFLTTTGWVSGSWDAALSWSGLRTPGLVLMGLAIFGGGVATTAGGVKLLRVYALYKHGTREMEKLVQPSSIGGAAVPPAGRLSRLDRLHALRALDRDGLAGADLHRPRFRDGARSHHRLADHLRPAHRGGDEPARRASRPFAGRQDDHGRSDGPWPARGTGDHRSSEPGFLARISGGRSA